MIKFEGDNIHSLAIGEIFDPFNLPKFHSWTADYWIKYLDSDDESDSD